MRHDSPEDGTDPDLAADPRPATEVPCGSAAIRPAQRAAGPKKRLRARLIPEDRRRARSVADADAAQDRLGAISDSLLVAYHLAKQDGDPLTVALIGRALMHTGRRIALGLSPAEAGIVRH